MPEQYVKSLNEADQRFDQMRNEYHNDWKTSHQDLRDYIAPTRGHFDDDDHNRGEMINHQLVLDGYATLASQILESGLMSGMTSPFNPWFKIEMYNKALNEFDEVRVWLDDTEAKMRKTMSQSNLYQSLSGLYSEIGPFGIGCIVVTEDDEDGIRCELFTVGEYYLGTNNKGRVNSFAREFWMTTEQMVNEFGYESVSATIQNEWDNNQRFNWHAVRHLIMPNNNRRIEFADMNGMPYLSLYWEKGTYADGFLARRGFLWFPVIAPRWETVTTHQVYGKGPGWHALGDVKQLQKTVDDKLKIQEKLHNPPMSADADMEGFLDLVPGGVTRTSFNLPDAGVKPTYTVPDALNSFIEMETHLKGNIDKFFFVNLFLMLMNIDKTNMTATEIAERQQEKIMMMGPILHKLQEELLDPLIDIVFNIMYTNGLLSAPPDILLDPANPELQELKIKYISILAQAQEAVGVQQIQRVMQTVTALAQARPDILDNFDFDEIAKQVNDMEGAPAKIILDDESIQELRQMRQQVQQSQQLASISKEGAQAGKALAEANKSAVEAQQQQ